MKKLVLMLFFLACISIVSAAEFVNEEDLVYEGAFRLPQGQYGSTPGSTYAYSGGMAYNPTSHSLFMIGHSWEQLVGEVSIPEIRNSNNLADLATGVVLQNFTDIAEGKKALVGSDGVGVFGLMVFDGLLYATLNIYYDAGYNQNLSHIVSTKNLSVTGDVIGPVKVGSIMSGYYAGWLVDVPDNWEDRLGPALTGACCIPIVTRTSAGPGAAFAFDPDDIGSVNPVPAVPLQYYTMDNNLGAWGDDSLLYNAGTEIVGAVFPEGTDSLIYFGRHGTGENCYGIGTGNQSLHRTPVEGTIYCYDPAESSKGSHTYPYIYQAWAYDANDLLKVKNGELQPWDVEPYAVWNFELPFQDATRRISGVAYDADNNRVILAQRGGEVFGMPVIHSFIVNLTVPPVVQEPVVVAPDEEPVQSSGGSSGGGSGGGGAGVVPRVSVKPVDVIEEPLPFIILMNNALAVSDGAYVFTVAMSSIPQGNLSVSVIKLKEDARFNDAFRNIISSLQ
jgi:hypothetical protein